MTDATRSLRASRRRDPALGVSLVEVMVSLVCISIATAIVLPTMMDNAPEQLRGAAQILMADLDFAQSASMSHGDNPRLLRIESDNLGYSIAAKATPDTPVTDPATAAPYRTRFGTGRSAALGAVRVGSYSLGGDDRLGFGALGQPDQTSVATITLVCRERSVVVTIDPTTGEAAAGPIQ